MISKIFGNCALYRHEVHSDERGSLIALEARDLPFKIERVYYIFGQRPGVERGFHAHRALHQWVVCVGGSCVMIVDDGEGRRDVVLDRPDLGLYIGPMIWREMKDFSADCVLMVLASSPYDEVDYIRDRDEFLELAMEMRQ